MMRYEMLDLSARIGLSERFFLTREKGEQAYPILKALLMEVHENDPLVLSFPQGQLVDASFADEAIIRLGQEIVGGMYGERAILLEGLTTNSIINIDAATRLQQLKLVLLVIEEGGKWSWIGQLDTRLAETLEIVGRLRQLTAPELAELLKLAVNTASNRLKRLHDKRLVRREHEITQAGLQYIYSFWEWDPSSVGG